MTAIDAERPAPSTWGADGLARLAVGLIWGVALFLLHEAHQAKAWPTTLPPLFAALVLAALFVPFTTLAGIGALRRPVLLAWTAAALGFAALLGAYDIWREPLESQGGVLRVLPSPAIWAAVAVALFIAHHLIEPADAERRPIARFATYFDTAWRRGVQLVMALAFTCVFWGLLYLGAALFKLIGVTAILTLIQHDAFRFLASTLVFAAAVQLTDARAGLVRGVRTVALTLLAWLLPLLVLIVGGFLATLPFTGLEPLWRTRSATGLLLAAAAHLIILTNAAYQDGTEAPPAALRWAARIASLLLVPLTVLAAYGLGLRVAQYGLSPERVTAAAAVLIAAGYALGYAIAAARSGAWMRGLERTNIVMAFVCLAVITALCTPIADPARLATADQLARLKRGAVAPGQFDYAFLRFDAGRHGRDALARLARDPAPAIAGPARAAQALRRRGEGPRPPPRDLRTHLTVHPKGARLPDSFYANPVDPEAGGCLGRESQCDALARDLTGDGVDEVILTAGGRLEVFKRDPDGHWRKLGDLTAPCGVFDGRAALREGRLTAGAPLIAEVASGATALVFMGESPSCDATPFPRTPR